MPIRQLMIIAVIRRCNNEYYFTHYSLCTCYLHPKGNSSNIYRLNFSPKFEKFLNLIPYTALAALICPGVLTVDPNLWYIGLIGAVIAGGLAWKKVPLGAIVILTVIVLVAVYLIVPFFPVLI